MSELTEQQKEAVFSIDKNVLVSAGAGSGKTHVLVERYIEVLRKESQLTVADLVAVTFTKKAASEMRTRLKARFQALKDESDGDQKQRWLMCMADIDGARIGTIHSLCESILKGFPVEGGVDPKFEVLDDIERAELYDESITEALRNVISTRSKEHDLLDVFDIEEVKRWLIEILNASLQFAEVTESVGDADDEVMTQRLNNLLKWARRRAICKIVSSVEWKSALEYLEENPWRDEGSELEEMRTMLVGLAHSVRASLEETDIDDDVWSSVQCLVDFPSARTKGGKDAKPLRDEMKRLRTVTTDYAGKLPAGIRPVDLDAFRLIRAFISLAQQTVDIYERKKRIVHRLDYDDLVRYTYRALEREGSLARKHFNETLRAILVDEFQDTNRTQARLVALLAGPKTRLFFIGDDKQSIYKFQGADVSNFNEWKAILRGEDPDKKAFSICGERNVIPLNKSFRSHPDLVCGVNAVFERLLDPGDDPQIYRAAFEGLNAHRERVGEIERVEVLYFDSLLAGVESPEQKNSYEAELICQWVEEKVREGMEIQLKDGSLSRPCKFGDFAILVQKNSHFMPLEEALTRRAIPYVTLGGRSFLKRQEIFDVENLLRFLDNQF
ncbi:MAG: UvrD-helicase domain-containing protein, partial [Leptolyngbya sp.]|nr:UvrD-helicase domain-containing protein [Candidatus Melainabacteria bacterium]